jgi:hypothetical protein
MHLNGGSVANASLKSTDLVFYSNTLTDIELNGGTAAAFAVYAPNAAVKINGNADIYGAIVGKSFEINGGAKVHYDKALGNLNTNGITCSSTEVSCHRSWPRSRIKRASFRVAAVHRRNASIATTADIANFCSRR